MSSFKIVGITRRILFGLARGGAFALFLGLMGGLAAPAPAHAEYDLCNKTSYVIRAAVAFRGRDDYQSAGWFTVYPGFCRPVIDKPLTQQTYYIHGRTILGHTSGMRHWSGDDIFCIAEKDFDIAGASNCEKRGFTTAYFLAVDVGHAKTWTTTFAEPSNLDLDKAKVLGVQRLLFDLGYLRASQMDGYFGGATARAIAKFKRQTHSSLPDEPSVKLLRALAQTADAKAKGNGLQLCNDTSYGIWAAVGIPEGGASVLTKGWFQIKPKSCVKPVIETLRKSYVYVYGETVDSAEKKLYWHGDNRLCTNDVMFAITAKPDTCDDRGFVPAGFAKVDTEGRAYWSYTFTEDKASPRSGS